MRRNLEQLLEWCIAFVIAVILTSIFSYGYRFYGINTFDPTGSTDFKWNAYQFKSNFEEGFSWIRTDENGYNNDYRPDTIDVLLMGGSHMEANQVMPHQKASYLLGEMTDYSVYNIGMTDHTLFMCLDNLENALDEYKPTRYVVIQMSFLNLIDDGAREILSGDRQKKQLHTNSSVPVFLRKIPSVMLVYRQLRDKLNVELYNSVSSTEKDPQIIDKNLLNEVLMNSASICGKKEVELILAYTPEIVINPDGKIGRNDNMEEVSLMKRLSEDNGIIFYDMFDDMMAGFDSDYKIPFGFNNTRIDYGHLNPYGHRLLAKGLSDIIMGN